MGRIGRSIELIKVCWRVLKADKELVVFPIVSAIALAVVTASFVLPWVAVGGLDRVGSESYSIADIALLAAFYVVQYFVVIFANSALIGAALKRLRGEDPTLGDGFRIAFSHLGSIIGYALIAATVGLILRLISEKAGFLGQIAVALVGTAWNIATFLAVPVLVAEDVGPGTAIKRSVVLLKKTWGEQIVGTFGIGLIFFLIALPVVIVGVVLAFVAGSAVGAPGAIAVIVVVVVAILALSLLSATMNGILAAAVYDYAVTGKTGGFFDESLIRGAFRQK